MLKAFITPGVALATVLFLVSCARAQESEPVNFQMDETPVDRSNGVRLSSYADVLEPARAAVVSVTSESIVRSYYRDRRNPMEELLRRFYGIPTPQAPDRQEEPEERRVPNGLGSGVIISTDGYILTNNHVVVAENGEPADEIMVQLSDRREFTAELVGRDSRTDIALLKIDAENLPALPIASSENLRVGDIVFAIGNPLGVGQTTTMGIVSAVGRTNLGLLGAGGYEDFIQTDAAINRGNSGGALVDAEGRLIGINSAILSPVGANIGIGFAIPSTIAQMIAEELVQFGEIQRGFLGVSIADLDDELAEAFQLKSSNGVLIQEVQEGSPAKEAGLQRGDVIVAVNAQPTDDVRTLRFRIASMRPGSDVSLTVVRENEEQSFEVTLGSLDGSEEVSGSGADTILEGVSLAVNNEARQSEWRLDTDRGILVTDVEVRSPYASVLQQGMVIVEVNGRQVDSISELRNSLRSGVNRLWISYRGLNRYVALRMR